MKTVKYWLPVLTWMALIFLGSSVPSARVSENGTLDFLAHKVVHLFEYAVLFLLIYRAVSQGKSDFNKREIVLVVFLVTFYGASDEFHQGFIPGREPRLRDVLIDFLGGLSGVGIWKYYPKVRKILSI